MKILKSSALIKPPAKSANPKIQETPKISKGLEKLLGDTEKKFGKNAIMLGFPKDEDGQLKVIERVPTGSISLDIALGGGLPLGRFTELSGAYSVSKTTQAMHIIRNAQKMGLRCAIIEAEAGSISEPYLRDLGVDVANLVYSPSEGLEEALQILFDLQRSGEVQLAVWDSIEASPPTKEYDTDMDDTVQMGIKPKLNNMYFRKFMAGNNYLTRRDMRPFTLIGINQLREAIGRYGDPEFTTGGRGKGFTAAIDLRLRKGDWIVEGKGENAQIVGQIVKFKVEKNKTFKRMQTGEFDFYFAPNSQGVKPLYNDNVKEIIVEGIEYGLIIQGGAWFTVNETGKKFQGLPALVEYLRPQKNLIDKFRKEIIDQITKETSK